MEELLLITDYLDEIDKRNLRIAMSANTTVSTPTSASVLMSNTMQASCGHMASLLDHSCCLLCDDFIDQQPGLCYLKLYDTFRPEMYNLLGYFPPLRELLKHRTQSWIGKTITYGRVLHVGGPPSLSIIREERRCCHCKQITRVKAECFQDDAIDRCSCGHWRRITHMIHKVYHEYKVGALIGYDIKHLIENSMPVGGYTCPPGKLSVHDVAVPYQGRVVRNNGTYTIQIGPYQLTGTIHDIKNMSHDFVANCWARRTDEKLQLLGVPYPGSEMTPDVINVNNRNVLELGTSFVNSESYLRGEFRGKEFKYEQELSELPIKLNVLIVSFNQIFCNLYLTEAQSQDLCARYVMIKPLEAIINEMEGFDVFAQKDSSDVRLVKKTFSTITDNGLDSYTYNTREILSFDQPVTHAENLEAHQILTNSFKNTEHIYNKTEESLNSYCNSFTPDNSRIGMKRVTNIPCILHSGESTPMNFANSDLPMVLKDLWMSSCSVNKEMVDLTNVIAHAYANSVDSIKHLAKLKSTFRFKASREDMTQLSLLGLGQKDNSSDDRVQQKRKENKKSFHPNAPTHDIEDFVKSNHWLEPIPKSQMRFENPSLINAVRGSKLSSTGGLGKESLDIWSMIRDTGIFNYSMMISEIFFELAINYKQWTKPETFLKKTTKSGIQMIIYNPKGHIYVSFAFPRSSKIMSTGRVGPNIFVTDSHFITDFSSFNEPTIEHFTKAGPYMGGVIAHLMTNSSSRTEFNQFVVEVAPQILLLFMNNKTDVEELITAQRYLFMKLFEDVGKGSYDFVSRLPEVLRSRLTSYYVQKTMKLMRYYHEHDILKVPRKEGSLILYDYLNIKSVFTTFNLSIEQLINSFYFGYVISKERGRGNNRTFKVLKKILQQEFNFRDTVKTMFSSGLTTPKYASNRSLLKVFSHLFSKILELKLGTNYKDTLFNTFCSDVAGTNFSVLATLKASSREHPEDFKIPIVQTGATSKEIFDELKKLNPKEQAKRPKVLEALIDLVHDYMEDTKVSEIKHEVELVPWCLRNLLDKGYFDSDCFAKPQHGGDREIHVLTICARMLQFHIETFSRVVCRFFPSETTVNPDTKKFFVTSHYQKSRDLLKTNYFVCSKSADATKWCQCHHSSHFAAMFSVISPTELRPFLISTLSLWPRKRLSFPMQQVSDFLANPRVQSNPTYERFNSEFVTGTGIFKNKCSNKIEIISGMFQGILHTTSSLYHTMVQECMKAITAQLLNNVGFPRHLITIIQGSDDSGMMLTLPGPPSSQKLMLARRVLQFKEVVSSHLSIYNSNDKSSIGTIDLIEYNSEWFVRHKIIKPTFRWISAAFSINVTERFIDRIRNFNSVLTECLTGGASTLECAIVQLFQCMLHYMLMGIFCQPTGNIVSEYITRNPEPLLGFFPCDFDISAGVTGVEFSLFSLFVNSSYGSSMKSRFDSDIELSYTADEAPATMQTKDLKSIRLRMGHMSIYEKLVRNISLGTYEQAIADVESDPMLIWGRHTTWAEEQPNLLLKVFSPGVKESLSNVSPSLRMIAASAYLHIFPCLSKWDDGKLTKHSLLSLLKEQDQATKLKLPVDKVFPLSKEFNRLYKSIVAMSASMATVDIKLRKVSRSTVIVFESPSDQLPLVDMCKRQWLNIGKIPLSRGQMSAHWVTLCSKFPFISPVLGIQGLRETCANLRCTVIELKSFLESLTLRSREVKLQDTEAKGKDVVHVMSRIYWPNTQIRHSREGDEVLAKKLRSQITSISTYWQVQSSLTQMIKEVLTDNVLLAKATDLIPNSVRKLKIMRDMLVGEDKLKLMRRIEFLKVGVIGVFTKAQGGYGPDRIGPGVWRGRICGVDSEIHMQHKRCERIVLKALGDTRSLGLTLIDLLHEFGLLPPAEKSTSDYYLEQNGRIVGSSKSELRYNIHVDRELEQSIVDNLENLDWDVEMAENQNVRLVVLDARRQRVEKMTVLSDNFTSRDWQPNVELDKDDIVLDNWARGNMCTTELLESQILRTFPKTRWEFSKGDWKKLENTHPWDLSKFRTQLINYVNPKFKIRKQEESAKTTDPTVSLDEFKEFRELTANMYDTDDFEKNVQEFLGDWADFDDTTDLTLLPSITDVNTEYLSELVKLFSSVQEYDEEFLAAHDTRGSMPTAASFFSSLETLSQLQTKESLKDCLRTSAGKVGIKYRGTLGKIMSIMSGIWMYDSDLEGETEASKWEAESIAITESVIDDEHLMALPLSAIETMIDELEAEIESSKGLIKSSLTETLDRYLRIRLLKFDDDQDTLDMSKSEYIEELIHNNIKLQDNFPKSRTYWSQFMTICLDDFYTTKLRKKEITNLEYQRALICIKTLDLSSKYKALCDEYVSSL